VKAENRARSAVTVYSDAQPVIHFKQRATPSLGSDGKLKIEN